MPTVNFEAARLRILALAETSIEIEAAKIPVEPKRPRPRLLERRPAATFLERLYAVHGDGLAEVLHLTIEESK